MVKLRPDNETIGRLVAIKCYLVRGQAEDLSSRSAAEASKWGEVAAESLKWIKNTVGESLLSDREWQTLYLTFGTWSKAEIARAFARVEAMAALLWVLGKVPTLPPGTRASSPSDLIPRVPFLSDIGLFCASVRHRDLEAVLQAQQTAAFWSWRVTLELLRREGQSAFEERGYLEVLRAGVENAAKAGVIVTCDEADYLTGLGVIHRVNLNSLEIALSVAAQREYAFNWLVGITELTSDLCY